MIRSQYFRKAYAFLLAGSLIPLVVITVLFRTVYMNAMESMAVASLQTQAENAGQEIDRFLRECAQISQTFASQLVTANVLSYSPGRIEIGELNKSIDLIMSGKTGKIALHVVGEGKAFSSGTVPAQYQYETLLEDSFFQKLAGVPRTSVFRPVRYAGEGGAVVLSVVTPVCDFFSNLSGFVIIDIYRGALLDLLSLGGSAMDCTVQYDGMVLLDTNDGGREGKTLELIAPLREREGYRALPGTAGMAREGHMLTIWNGGAYNRVTRVFTANLGLVTNAIGSMGALFALLVLLAALLALALAAVLSLRQTRPILALHDAMDRVGKGDLKVHIDVHGKDELAELGRRFNLLVQEMDQNVHELIERQEQLRQSQIMALQAQINPHFLYNSLGAIKSLTKMNRLDEVSQIVIHLGTLLRSNLSDADKLITLCEDIELIRSYMCIQNIRFRDKFDLVVRVPKPLLAARLPSILLQPLVENCIEHGLEPKAGRGTLTISAWRIGGDLYISIADDGVSVDEQTAYKLNHDLMPSSYIGYRNVKRRIELFYGQGYSIHIARKEVGTEVVLKIKFVTASPPAAPRDV